MARPPAPADPAALRAPADANGGGLVVFPVARDARGRKSGARAAPATDADVAGVSSAGRSGPGMEAPSEHRARMDWFKEVILPHEPALRRHLVVLRAPGSDHDDLVSEALTRAFTAQNWRGVQHGRSYLFAIARNLILDGVRRAKVVTLDLMSDLEALDVPDNQPSAEAVVTARDELRRLRRAIDALPTQRRRVFIRRRVDGVDIETIAREMRIARSTAEKHLTQALAQLTRLMADEAPLSAADQVRKWRKTRT